MEENKDKAEGTLQLSVGSKNKNPDAYGNLVRGLTPDELSQSGTQKLILNDLSKSETKVSELEPYREKYYEIFTQKCVLEEKLAKANRAEVLYSFCIIAGGIIIGLAKNFIEAKETLAIIMIMIGVLFKTTFKR